MIRCIWTWNDTYHWWKGPYYDGFLIRVEERRATVLADPGDAGTDMLRLCNVPLNCVRVRRSRIALMHGVQISQPTEEVN